MANIESRLFRIDELIRQVREGVVRAPRFQRGFVWQRSQVLHLLDSIRHRYPIGTLFLWKTSGRYSSFDRIGPVRVPVDAPPSPSEVAYVLDGHQRVSCLVGVLGISEEEAASLAGADRTFLVHYDLKSRRFDHVRFPEDHHFPVRYLLQSLDSGATDRLTAWLDERRDRAEPGSPERVTWDAWRREVFELQRTFAQYQVRYDDVTRAKLDEAVQIFARVNQQGTPARPADVFAALSWRPDGFDFAHSARALVARTPGFERLGTQPILRALLACLGRSMYERRWTEVLKAHGPELPEVFGRVAVAFERAVTFLRDSVGACHASVVPYALQIAFLTWFFDQRPDPSPGERHRLIEWFWATSYGATYGGAGALSLDEHMQRATSLLRGEDQPVLPHRVALQALPHRFHPRSARVRAWHLFLATLHPRDPATGELLSNPLGGGLVDARPVAPGDRGWMLGARVLMGRGVADPREALTGMASGPREAQVLDSHGIDGDALDALRGGDLDTFIRRRFDLLQALESRHAGRFVELPSSPESADEPEIDSDIIDDFDAGP